MKKNQNKYFAIIAFSLLASVGTYNAIMINSNSNLSAKDAKHFKRLDEVYGIVKEGRAPAVTTNWKKVSVPAEKSAVAVEAKKIQVASVNEELASPEAVINESLDLKLVEVINPKKWKDGVNAADFNGSIATGHGVIESLKASLPQGMNIDISFSEMTGNTFEYDMQGDIFSGMMYQVDQNSYMITLTNGPLEGTRLRFTGDSQDAQSQEAYLAETHNVEVGSFGSEIEAVEMHDDSEAATLTAEAPLFNFNSQL